MDDGFCVDWIGREVACVSEEELDRNIEIRLRAVDGWEDGVSGG